MTKQPPQHVHGASAARNPQRRSAPHAARHAALSLTGAALFIAALGGGMLNDKVIPAPEWGGPFSLAAVPMAMALIGAALALAFWHDGGTWRWTPPLVGFGLLFVWSALSLLRTGYLYASIHALTLLAAALAVGAVIARAARTQTAVAGMALALAGAATVVAAIGINEYVQQWRGGNPLWRVFATFSVPNFLAGFLMMTVPVTAALFLSLRQRHYALLAGFALLLQTICLLLTGSRFGLVTLLFALLVFAVLAIRSGTLVGMARRRTLIVLGLVTVAVLVGGRPIVRRLFSIGSESYSNQFRLHTWRGTTRMAQVNPLLGTGLGTFETAYPPYAEIGYTQHAHNSFIQMAGEIGFPGVLFFLVGLSGTLAAGTAALRATEGRKESADAVMRTAAASSGRRNGASTLRRQRSRDEIETASLHPFIAAEPRLLLAGLLAAIAGAVAHNLFDSDLYVPANALTLASVCGLTLALSHQTTPASPLHPFTPSPFHPFLRYTTLAASLLLVVHALLIANGRMRAYGAAVAISEGRGAEALEGYSAAAALDRWNPEHLLSLASLCEASNQPDRARRHLDAAAKIAPIGKVLYRYGRFFMRQGQAGEAVRMHERARELEPRNLQNLLALAEAYKAAKRSADAEAVYAQMIRLYRSPFGAVRAVPELVDWEFGLAYLGLAEAAIERGDRAEAERDLREGAGILGQFWLSRSLQIFQIRVRPDTLRTVARRYDRALEQWSRALRDLGRAEEAVTIEERRARFRAELEKELGGSL